jgi:hypothetical protein
MNSMHILNKLPSFACGMAVAVVASTLYVELGAQTALDAVDVCAKSDGTLRLATPAPCETGEQRIRLRQPKIEEPKKEPNPDEAQRLADLGKRVKALEESRPSRQMGSRVYAPFEVINKEGYQVFVVEEDMVKFMNASGTTVGRVVMADDGGYFEARSTTKNLRAAIGTRVQRPAVLVLENDTERLSVGRTDAGGYSLKVFEPGGKLVAGLGTTERGDGLAFVADKQGVARTLMSVLPDGGGSLEVRNAEGKLAAHLWGTPQGNGRMQLINNAGTTMVEAGVNEANVGVVRAGPAGFHPGVGILGLPGSFIAGKASP